MGRRTDGIYHLVREVGEGDIGSMDAESDMEQNWFPLYPGDHYVDRGLLDTRS